MRSRTGPASSSNGIWTSNTGPSGVGTKRTTGSVDGASSTPGTSALARSRQLLTGVQHRRSHSNLVLADLIARSAYPRLLAGALRLLRRERRDERQRETDDDSSG